jgi:hypothetical protein
VLLLLLLLHPACTSRNVAMLLMMVWMVSWFCNNSSPTYAAAAHMVYCTVLQTLPMLCWTGWMASCCVRTPTATAAAAAVAAFAPLHCAADIANAVLDGVHGILLGAHES